MKETKYILNVSKLSTITIDSPSGVNFSAQMKLIWTATFKSESEMIERLIDFTSRGHYCQVFKVD